MDYPLTTKSTDELIEDVVRVLYNNGVFGYSNMKYIAYNNKYSVTDNQSYAILRKLKLEEFIDTMTEGRDGLETTLSIQEFQFTLSPDGRKKMLKHNSYANYKKHQKRIIRNDNIERNIKNGNIVASLLISAVAVILTQCPINNKKQHQKIEQGIESLAKQLDSLKQELRNMPKHSDSKKEKDTATNKE